MRGFQPQDDFDHPKTFCKGKIAGYQENYRDHQEQYFDTEAGQDDCRRYFTDLQLIKEELITDVTV